VTVNDVVLAAVAGALRQWCVHHNAALEGVRVQVPVSCAPRSSNTYVPMVNIGVSPMFLPVTACPATSVTGSAANAPVSVGVQLPASIALRILPDTALAQAPAAKTVQYTLIGTQVVLVDPTNMRVVDIINQ